MWQYNYSSELYHHGIKGQKWGVRRFQYNDGSLTNAGRKRYDDGNENRPKAKPVMKKSKHRQNLENKYRQRGMSPKEAEAAADKRIITEKFIAGVGAMTLAAAATYVAAKQIAYRKDGTIKAGTKIQRITKNKDETLDNAIYGAYKKSDKLRYKGLLGRSFKDGSGKDVYNMTINTNKDVKVASRKKAVDAFMDLWENDDDFRSTFNKTVKDRADNTIFTDDKLTKMAKKIDKSPEYKTVKQQAYDFFNYSLTKHTDDHNAIAKKFYDKLKEQGYDAIIDVNDKKYSGYNSKKPVIFFNNKNMSINNVEKMAEDYIDKNYRKAMKLVTAEDLAKQAAVSGLASYGITKGVNKIIVDSYRKKHPNSKLTDKEIIKMMNGKK